MTFISLGYRDYIASRFLLNNGYYFQGLTLASSAVEKYIKAVLALNEKNKKVHLDNLSNLTNILSESYFDFTIYFDKRFMDFLGKAYQIRYYDKLKEPISIGFFVNQFLGELDFIIDFFENNVILELRDEKGFFFKSQYKREIDNINPDLFLSNYILNGITKKKHMEKPDIGVGMYFNPQSTNGEINVFGKDIVNEYDGIISEIKFQKTENNEINFFISR